MIITSRWEARKTRKEARWKQSKCFGFLWPCSEPGWPVGESLASKTVLFR